MKVIVPGRCVVRASRVRVLLRELLAMPTQFGEIFVAARSRRQSGHELGGPRGRRDRDSTMNQGVLARGVALDGGDDLAAGLDDDHGRRAAREHAHIPAPAAATAKITTLVLSP